MRGGLITREGEPLRRTANSSPLRPVVPGAALLLLTWIVAGSSMPGHALCGGEPTAVIPTCDQRISSGTSYVFSPGCEDVDCGSSVSSVTDALVGQFWGLGRGDPAQGMGSDNGTFPALRGLALRLQWLPGVDLQHLGRGFPHRRVLRHRSHSPLHGRAAHGPRPRRDRWLLRLADRRPEPSG